jgi:hypothetical protein
MKGVETLETNVLDVLVSDSDHLELLELSILIGDLCLAADDPQYLIIFIEHR